MKAPRSLTIPPLSFPLLIAACSLLLAPSSAGAGAGRWTSFGPGGGYVTQVLPDPAGGLYASTEAGLFHSEDDGATWTACGQAPVGTEPSFLFSPEAAFTPDQPGTLWASRRGLLSRSTDRCSHWTPVADSVGLVAVTPGEPPTLFAGGWQEVFRSRDGGATWATLAIDSRQSSWHLLALQVDPRSPQTVYAAFDSRSSDFTAIFRSDDGGDSWRSMGPSPNPPFRGPTTAFALAPSQPATLYTISGITTFRSDDGGSTWSEGGQVIATQLVVSPFSPEVLWATEPIGGVLARSRDGGKTWRQIDSGLPDARGFPRALTVAAEPRQAGILWAGTNGSGVYRSTDNGHTWSAPGLQRGLMSLDVTALHADPWDSKRFYITLASLYGGPPAASALYSRDGAQTWEPFAQKLSDPAGGLTNLAFLRGDHRACGLRQETSSTVTTGDRPGSVSAVRFRCLDA